MEIKYNVIVQCSNCGKQLEASYHEWLGDADLINVKPCDCRLSVCPDRYVGALAFLANWLHNVAGAVPASDRGFCMEEMEKCLILPINLKEKQCQ
jgi:hypothetical protein